MAIYVIYLLLSLVPCLSPCARLPSACLGLSCCSSLFSAWGSSRKGKSPPGEQTNELPRGSSIPKSLTLLFGGTKSFSDVENTGNSLVDLFMTNRLTKIGWVYPPPKGFSGETCGRIPAPLLLVTGELRWNRHQGPNAGHRPDHLPETAHRTTQLRASYASLSWVYRGAHLRLRSC